MTINHERGETYAQEHFAEFKRQHPNVIWEVSFRMDSASGDGSTMLLRFDGVAEEDGRPVLVEYKSSENAPFTRNQQRAYHVGLDPEPGKEWDTPAGWRSAQAIE
ncbi:hypothetical protein [Olsenella sp. Marseille-P4559]|uniref:hypothetical protein n=1 Tax=Olsenella sp. Marseille-P4559 TaxID=2364795 RepID=UPI001030DCDA|nr:hypothetical protein [Olsenella sp. Marseille-P4559]